MAGLLHRTATTAYSCCLPALGGFSRSWSCKTCRRKDRGVTTILRLEIEVYAKENILVSAKVFHVIACCVALFIVLLVWHQLKYKGYYLSTSFSHIFITVLFVYGNFKSKSKCNY